MTIYLRFDLLTWLKSSFLSKMIYSIVGNAALSIFKQKDHSFPEVSYIMVVMFLMVTSVNRKLSYFECIFKFGFIFSFEYISKAVVPRCSVKKVSLKISQNSQEYIFVGVFFALFRFTDLGLAFQSVLELETIFCNNYMLVTENFVSY